MKLQCTALLSLVLLGGSSTLAQTNDTSRNANSPNVTASLADSSAAESSSLPTSLPASLPAQKTTPKASSGTDGGNATYSPIAATTGTLGLFTLETGDLLPKGGWSASGYGNRFTRMPGSVVVTGIGVNFGYGLSDRWNLYANMIKLCRYIAVLIIPPSPRAYLKR